MRIKTISYQKSFVIGPYLQEKIGVEIELTEAESNKENYENFTFSNAKAMVEKWHKEANPGLEITMNPEVLPTIAVEKSVGDKITKEISTVKELKVLESYRLIAAKNPSIQSAYDKKLKELTT
jgi:hypothetical protein